MFLVTHSDEHVCVCGSGGILQWQVGAWCQSNWKLVLTRPHLSLDRQHLGRLGHTPPSILPGGK